VAAPISNLVIQITLDFQLHFSRLMAQISLVITIPGTYKDIG
jgi:hypothetical protein